MTKRNEPGRLVPVAEVCERELIPVSLRTLMRLIAAGRIRAVNIGAGSVPRWALAEAEIVRFKQSMGRGSIETK